MKGQKDRSMVDWDLSLGVKAGNRLVCVSDEPQGEAILHGSEPLCAQLPSCAPGIVSCKS